LPQHPGPRAARAHLRLAGSLAAPRRAENRALLLARAALAFAVLAILTIAAWAGAAVALAPIVWRRAPLGCRVRPIRPPEARVIQLQPRQRRQTASPR
jgi:hypothetical protein